MPTRNRLLARAEIDGALRDPGYIFTLADGVLGPHRTVVASNHGAQITDHENATADVLDVPLYVPIDGEVEKEREALAARHAEELAALERDPERDELRRKHAEEAAALGAKAAKRELELKHEREDDALKERQHAETASFQARASAEPIHVPAPRETKEEDLKKRHEAEAKALADKHATEQAALDGTKPAVQEQATIDEGKPLLLDPPVSNLPATA